MIQPLVSVILPCYNGMEFLAESIESVLKQSFKNLELLIIDDGSSDQSINIARKYALLDTRVRLFSHANNGLAFTLNRGIRLSSGELIARIDDDDVWSDLNKLEKQVAEFQLNKRLVLCGTSMKIQRSNGIINIVHVKIKNRKQALYRLLSKKTIFSHSSIMFKKSSAQRIKGYRAQILLAEDFDLYLRLAEIGEVSSIPNSYITFRQNDGGLTGGASARESLMDSFIAISSYYCRRYEKTDFVDDYVDPKKLKSAFLENGNRRNLYLFIRIALRKNFFELFRLCLDSPRGFLSIIFNRKSFIEKATYYND